MSRKVRVVRGLGSPAAANMKTGEILIDRDEFPALDRDAQAFVLLHEGGHLVLNTRDELAADKWAHERYLNAGRSPRKSIEAMTRGFRPRGNAWRNPEHAVRARLQLERAIKFEQQNQPEKPMNWDHTSFYNGEEALAYATGKKKSPKGPPPRQVRRDDRAAAKNEVRQAKAQALRDGTFKGGGTKILDTMQGIAASAGQALGGMAAGKLSASGSVTVDDGGAGAGAAPPAKNNTMLYVGIAIAVVIVLALVMMKGKKK